MNSGLKIKYLIIMLALFLLSISSFAVSYTNDASAFITRAEYDALSANYNSKLKDINASTDEAINDAIAKFLGDNINLSQEFKPDWNILWSEEEFNNELNQRLYVPDSRVDNAMTDVTLLWNIYSKEPMVLRKKEERFSGYYGDDNKYFLAEDPKAGYITFSVASKYEPGSGYYYYTEVSTKEKYEYYSSIVEGQLKSLYKQFVLGEIENLETLKYEMRNICANEINDPYFKYKMELHILIRANDISNHFDPYGQNEGWWYDNWGIVPPLALELYCEDDNPDNIKYGMIIDRENYVGNECKMYYTTGSSHAIQNEGSGYYTISVKRDDEALNDITDEDLVIVERKIKENGGNLRDRVNEYYGYFSNGYISRPDLEFSIRESFFELFNEELGGTMNGISLLVEYHIFSPGGTEQEWLENFHFKPPGVFSILVSSDGNVINIFQTLYEEEEEETKYVGNVTWAAENNNIPEYYYYTVSIANYDMGYNEYEMIDLMYQYFDEYVNNALCELFKQMLEGAGIYNKETFTNQIQYIFNNALHFSLRRFRYKIELHAPCIYSDYFGFNNQTLETWLNEWGCVPPCTMVFYVNNCKFENYEVKDGLHFDEDECLISDVKYYNSEDIDMGYVTLGVGDALGTSSTRFQKYEYYVNYMKNNSDLEAFGNILNRCARGDINDEHPMFEEVAHVLTCLPYRDEYDFRFDFRFNKSMYEYRPHSSGWNDEIWIDRWGFVPPGNITFYLDYSVSEHEYHAVSDAENDKELAKIAKGMYVKKGFITYKTALYHQDTDAVAGNGYIVENAGPNIFYYGGRVDLATVLNTYNINFMPYYDFSNPIYWFKKKTFDKHIRDITIPLSYNVFDMEYPDAEGHIEIGYKGIPVWHTNKSFMTGCEYSTFTNEAVNWSQQHICYYDQNSMVSTDDIDIFERFNISEINADDEPMDAQVYIDYDNELNNYLTDNIEMNHYRWPKQIKDIARIERNSDRIYAHRSEYDTFDPPYWIYVNGRYYDKNLHGYHEDAYKLYFKKLKLGAKKQSHLTVSFDSMYSKGISDRVGYNVSVGGGIPIAKTGKAQNNSILKFRIHLKDVETGVEWYGPNDNTTAKCTVCDKQFINGEMDPEATAWLFGYNIPLTSNNPLIEVPITCEEDTTVWLSILATSGIPQDIINSGKYAIYFSDVSIEQG